MEFHSSTSKFEAGDDASGVPSYGQLEMPDDGSTEAVSGKGLTCTVGGFKVGGGGGEGEGWKREEGGRNAGEGGGYSFVA